MIRFRLWPGLVFVLLGMNACVVGVTLYLAHSDPSFAAEPDYYQKALAWDETARQNQANAALGWRVETRWEPAASPRRAVEFVVRDGAGAPVAGAGLRAEAFASLRPRERVVLTPDEVEPGVYRSVLPNGSRGLWEFRLRAQRGADVFTASLEGEAPAGGGAGGGSP